MKAILLLALSVIVLSQGYGLADAAVALDADKCKVQGIQCISLSTDSVSYESGEMINILGIVSDYDASDPFKNFDVTLKLIAPNGNIISIYQEELGSDGSYSVSIPAQGPLWKFDGDYTITASHGSDRNVSVIFAFISSESDVVEEVEETGEEVIEISEEELSQGCGEGTHLEDGICVLDETAETTPVSTGTSPSTGFNSWIYSISFTILIAFAIMIILYLISRASRNKNDN